MSVISQLQNIAGFVRIQPSRNAAPGLRPFAEVDTSSRGDFLEARSRLLRIQRALDTLADLANVSTRFKLDLPDARSTQSLGLDLTNTAAALVSTEEINASATSFTPFGPEWNDGSNAPITIGGEYNGAHGSGQLRFEVLWPGTRGVDDLRIRVDDPLGKRIKNVTIRANHEFDRQYSLNNGLYLTLGSGSLANLDTTTIDVFDAVGSAVDPNKPLGGARNDNPNLQFGAPQIVDGAFQINGESVSVSTTDTLNDVVDRINASNAGVTAYYDGASERIGFVQNTLGSVADINIEGDTSNFVEATKLNSAVLEPGVDPDTVKTLENVGAFSSIQSGSIRINGTLIAVDTATDSLTTVIGKINASSAGVNASFDAQSRRVVIEADDAASVLELDGNGTEFFAALSVPEGRVDPEVLASGISLQRSYRIADAVETLARELNVIFKDDSFRDGARNATVFRSPLDAALSSALDNADGAFGLRFDRSADALQRGEFAAVNRRTLTRSLQLRGDDVKTFFAGADGNSGLIARLYSASKEALQAVSARLGSSGTIIDTFA